MTGDARLAWYGRLPYPGKVAAATIRGAQLRAWRYGRRSDRLVVEALERDRWSPDRWKHWQDERLAEVLARAAANVPRHRAWFQARPDRDPGRLSDWPVLPKDEVRDDPQSFLSEVAPRLRYVDQTSGTTGTPVKVHASRPDLRSWFALIEARNRRWHGVGRHDRWAMLGGQLVAPAGRTRPPYWVWNPALHQLYLSSHNITPASAGDYAAALGHHAPTHVVAYPSMAAHLARVGLDAGLRAHGPKVVIANAEPVTPAQRELIEAYFGCPVRETYGMAEMAAAATECEAGTLHLADDAGIVEVVDEQDRVVAPGESGRLLLTGLVNQTMPLIRYDIGDRGQAPFTSSPPCACGRRAPVLPRIEGRSQDLLVTAAGGRVFWINPVFYDLPVHEAQVRQVLVDRVQVLVVPTTEFDAATAATITDRLRARLGEVEVEVELRQRIERDPNGKFRPVVSEVG